jgi:hypothetical protein
VAGESLYIQTGTAINPGTSGGALANDIELVATRLLRSSGMNNSDHVHEPRPVICPALR